MGERVKAKKDLMSRLIYIAVGLIFVFSIVNIYLINIRFERVEEAREIAKEIMRPANLEIIKLVDSGCVDCFDIEKSFESLKNLNVNVTKEEKIEFGSSEGKELIEKYNIEKIPVLIVKGEVNKSDQLVNFFVKNGKMIDNKSAVYFNINPPYYDVNEGEVVGRVKIVNIIDSGCELCVDLNQIPLSLEKAGVKIIETKNYEYNSMEGEEFISNNEIKRIPALLISEDINYYENIKKDLEKIAQLRDGYYAIHSTLPPYRDLEKDEIVGMVDLILLFDSSCEKCFDVEINKNVLERFGVVIDKIDRFGVTTKEAQELIKKYDITKIPTALISPEIEVYENFVQVWQNVGSVEEDGWLVMRNPGVLGTYKDLVNNTVVEARRR